MIEPRQHTTRLAAGWDVTRVSPGRAETPAALQDPSLAPTLTWYTAPDVTTAAAALSAAGAWHFDDPLDFDAWDWWFRCRFPAPERADDGVRHILGVGGLATIADLWLNDAHLLHSDNMFLAHELDVSTHLRDNNELYIRCSALATALRTRRPRPAWRTRLVAQQQLRWIRTTLLGRMPGWSASPQPVGPWRAITLERRGSLEIVTSDIRPRLEGTDGVLELRIHVRTQQNGTITHARGTVAPHGAEHHPKSSATVTETLRCVSERDGTVISGTVRVPNVARWWPHTHGAQPRYDARVTVHLDDAPVTIGLGTVAFRTIALDTTDGNFAIHVNGVPVFCRGACWSSVDVTRVEGTADQYRAALVTARDGGMNMVRVGGTMTYEADAFYDACDELGILVWQDFMFANMDYPFADETFAASVAEEVRQFLHRTQTRACLAILCGNSEIEQQVAMLGLPPSRWDIPFFRDTLPAACRTRRPDVPYWPSSPSGGTLPFHVNTGDAHYFGYGPYLRSLDDVRTSNVRFASETLAFAHVPDQPTIDLLACGTNGAGHHPAWKAAVPRDNGASWDFEDVRDHYVEQLFGVSARQLRYGDVERYVALGRVASGEVISRALSEWRRADSRCNGALLWFYRDLRPGAGWGVVDATGRPKAAYYYFRRTAAPVAVVIGDDGLNGLTLTAINDTPVAIDAELRLTLVRHGEVIVATAAAPCPLGPRGAVSRHADAMLDGFVDLSYAYRFGPPNHELVVAELVDRASGVTVSDAYAFPAGLPNTRETTLGIEAMAVPTGDGCYRLTVRTRRFAQSVAVNVDHYLADDNYFHVAPGRAKDILLRPLRSDGPPLRGTVEPLNAVAPTSITLP